MGVTSENTGKEGGVYVIVTWNFSWQIGDVGKIFNEGLKVNFVDTFYIHPS